MSTPQKYIPALRFNWLTPLYDPLLKWGMREETFKRHLIEQAQIQPGMRVLDLGCGTGTLTVMIKQFQPKAAVVGLDGDPAVLEIARSKANQLKVDITLDLGMVFKLPYPDHSLDRVLSSLVFHHLNTDNKRVTLKEIYRVLKPAGELHIVDFGKPRGFYAWLISLVMRRFEEAQGNLDGKLPLMMRDSGFMRVEELAQYQTIVGGLSLLKAKKVMA